MLFLPALRVCVCVCVCVTLDEMQHCGWFLQVRFSRFPWPKLNSDRHCVPQLQRRVRGGKYTRLCHSTKKNHITYFSGFLNFLIVSVPVRFITCHIFLYSSASFLLHLFFCWLSSGFTFYFPWSQYNLFFFRYHPASKLYFLTLCIVVCSQNVVVGLCPQL